MTLEQLTELYAMVLRQLLPVGGYDTSADTNIAKDIKAHAKAIAQADLDSQKILKTIQDVPEELLAEYENEYGLPLKCSISETKTVAERMQTLKWMMSKNNILSRNYVKELLALFGIELVNIVNYKPLQCTAPCTSPVNTEILRYKVRLVLKKPVNADLSCILDNYFPAYLEYLIDEVNV